ncbi:hybrid sensor histidine kinase/response regulator transcription factor [Sinomicrobium weinanense]|uniref:histidine kinase n=1 Tax=Sinomicrobium weinanense TaxID=2842200 RepID=A0A926Q4P8_9FLAO|nr:hybrid sensor histidine kinase/response regulator transcription factor [Sinomicrobium weinanense]MBC9797125.1 response regulator [Sinomicrobium weinanense]MBU3124826.1 response regulator [Sinomicrobium weinanense]
MRGFWLVLICCFCIGRSQAQTYAFKKLRVEEGLSHNSVICMLQDNRGFLWFGTKDGLNRYDGYNFKLFQHEPGDEKSIGSNFIRCLHEYGNYIWVGTDMGLFRYDEQTESFILIESTKDRPILDIEGDVKGNLWFIAGGDLHRLNINDPDGKEEKFNQIHASLLTSNISGEVFVSAREGFYQFVPDNNSLKKIDLVNQNSPDEGFIITAISSQGKDSLLIGTKNRGPLLYKRSEKKLISLLEESENPLFVRDFLKKNQNELWIASESGIYIYDLRDHSYRNLRKDYNNPYALSDNAIYALVLDKEQGVWIGTYFGGVNYYSKQYTPIRRYFPKVGENSISGNAVREIEKDRFGHLWIGTEDAGLNRFDPETGKFINYTTVGEKGNLANYNIHGLLPVGDKLWIGTFEHGLDIMDINSGKVVKHFGTGEDEGNLRSDFIFFIYKTRAGDIYVLTSSGIYQYLPEKDTFKVAEGFPEVFHYTCFIEDHNGVFWAGTYWDGLYYYNPATNDKGFYRYDQNNPNSLSSNVINGLFEDSGNRLWITTENGLNLFQEDTNNFRRFTKKDGLPTNVTYSILEDDNKNLWISSSNGLLEFDPEAEVFNVYTRSNGLLSDQFNYSSAFKDEDGEMYFGGVSGLISFNPDKFVRNDFRSPVYITNIQVNNKEVPVGGEDSPLERSISFSERIVLDNKQSTFSLEFASLSYTTPEMAQYWYKLEGLNDQWVALGKNHEVRFTELPPGNYTFKVKALNSQGAWSDESSLAIEVLPPFLGSNTAYALYAILLLLLVYLLLRYYHRYTKNKSNRKIHELENEKEKEIYEAKIEFFTNIAHEIRTPLTLIKNPLEKLLKRQYKSPEIPKNLGIMEKNTARLINLVNELLDFRKTEMKHMKLSFVEVNISDILEETYIRFSQLIQDRSLHFDLIKDKNDVYAFVDEGAIKKIFSNLFINAIKYSESRVQVFLSTDETEFQISIENDGQLIPTHLKKRIFEPFFRLPGEAENPGTGIGLSLAHSLTELHHGKLYIDEERRAVNTFILKIPLHQDEEFKTIGSDHERMSAPDPKTQRPGFEKQAPLILIAEDNKELANFMYGELSENYNVIQAGNGKEAWAVISDREVELVISDVMMPISDGIQLCKRIKGDVETSHIPVILLTAKSALNAKIEGLESGADAYISKPFSMNHLEVQISNLLKNRKTILGHYSSSPLAHLRSLATSNTDKTFLSKLDKVIDKNLNDPDLNIDMLAKHMYMSRSTLYRKIKDISDLSPYELINMSRLKKAAELLKTTNLKIYEISEKVGYKSQTSFGRNFQKHFGMTPTDYAQDGSKENKKV